jgi:hypothetical protein
MDEKHSIAWTSVTNSLKTAALLPQQRDELIGRALQELLSCIPALGTALIWPCRDGKAPWKVYYAGIRRHAMSRWLMARLDPSLEVMIGEIEHDLARQLSDMPPPLLIRLHTLPSSPRGVWIIWPNPPSTLPLAGQLSEPVERVHQIVEALLEVEDREEQYFSTSSPVYDRELVEALSHGDSSALSALLGLTRVVANADFTFWARAYQDVIEIAGHLGAKYGGFGFALPRGSGVGGRVAAYGTPIVRGDYRNSPYRDPSVCDIVDRELIRSGMALPVRYNTAHDADAHVAAVLYATRRTSTPFSQAERLLVQRLTRLLEPLPFENRATSFFSPGVRQMADHKAVWYDIVLHANHIEPLEAWAGQLIKGAVIVTDSDGHPYVYAHTEQLEQVKARCHSQPDTVQVLSLAAPGVSLPGQVYLCPSIALPPAQWPDFFADLTLACNLVIARMAQAQDQLDRQREQWVRGLLKGKSSQHVEQDGYRLGLPIEHGQLWVLAWPVGAMSGAKTARKRMTAASVVLDTLKSPLIFLDDETGVVLFEEQASRSPAKVRDALLKHCGPHELWIVHGVRYRSLDELKMTLTHAISIAQKARREACGDYLLDIYTFGLDSLLENPRLAEDLDAFATKLLTPLIEYDAANGSHFTETFVLVQTLGSAQVVAEQLSVHVNTVRYRLHRAEDILLQYPASGSRKGKVTERTAPAPQARERYTPFPDMSMDCVPGTEQRTAKEQTARALAAFIWQRFHMQEQLLA